MFFFMTHVKECRSEAFAHCKHFSDIISQTFKFLSQQNITVICYNYHICFPHVTDITLFDVLFDCDKLYFLCICVFLLCSKCHDNFAVYILFRSMVQISFIILLKEVSSCYSCILQWWAHFSHSQHYSFQVKYLNVFESKYFVCI